MKLKCFQSLGITILRITIGSLTISTQNSVLAQIAPDATLPNNSQVRLENNIRFIEGGTQAGGNLFHSFREFSVPTNSTAFFNNNSANVQNIIGRVTGGSLSNIDGLIRANGTANLFLINPNGIIFGENAWLKIGGSFISTSANSMKFADGFEYSTNTTSNIPLLTISVPTGLQFGTNPGSIQVIGDGLGLRNREALSIPPMPGEPKPGLSLPSSNQTLALIGGDVSLQGATLKTYGGRIELGSVEDNSLVVVSPTEKGFSLGYGTVQNFGNIQLSKKASVDASGEGSGDIFVTSRNLTLTDGSTIEASTLGSKPGGVLVVNVREQVKLSGISKDIQEFPSGFFGETFPKSSGSRGDVIINTHSLQVEDGAQVSASVKGSGRGGNLVINAEKVELLDGNTFHKLPTALSVSNQSKQQGSAGDMVINARVLAIRDGAFISARTLGDGKGGNLIVNATESVEITGGKRAYNNPATKTSSTLGTFQVTPNARGAAGDITIKTPVLLVKDGGQIRSDTFGAGNGGKLTVEATQVKIIGSSNSELPRTLLTTQVNQGATGLAGNLDIKTRELLVQGRAQVITGTNGSGKGGDLVINATDKVRLQNNQENNLAQIVVEGKKTGNAGNLTINADSIRLDKNAIIDASTQSINKDPSKVQATINLRSQDIVLSNASKIRANAQGNNVIGGNLDIKTGVLATLENSQITANSNDSAGGRVLINTKKNFISPGSEITAIGKTPELIGEVQIKTPDIDTLKGTIVLPVDVVDGSRLINKNFCALAYDSRFVITGRGGLPPSPYDIQEDYYTTWEDWRMNPVTQSQQNREQKIQDLSGSVPAPIIEAQGWVTNNKGEVELVAFTPDVTPHNLQNAPIECR
ncbi:MAG: S-layer family protein [Scytonematopsis contorta HA4267-MV1]|jgi:filamentous hemagglutinin family protein|nr:S-layer family protein [Scytonematopsis contorta HA4267-MV1]